MCQLPQVPFYRHLKTIKDKNWGEAIKFVGAVTAIILIFGGYTESEVLSGQWVCVTDNSRQTDRHKK